MIILKLLTHQWKEKVRSPFWQKSIWLNILLAIAALYLILCVISLGFLADKLLSDIYKDRDVVQAFTGLLFYFFSFDLVMRFLVQKIPVISMMPYMTLPVKRSTLIHYPLLKTMPGFFNLLSLCLILPFYFKTVLPSSPHMWSTVWIVTVLSLIITNNFLAFFLKKYFAKKPLLIFLIMALVGAIAYFDFSGRLNMTEWVASAFLFLEKNPRYDLFPPLIALGSYELAYIMLKNNSYIEEEKKSVSRVSPGFSFLSKYGEIGLLMQNELRMLFRNRRPRSMMLFGVIFLLYGFVFYTPHNIDKQVWLIFAGIFITSAAGLFYAQFLFEWESSFFDTYLSNRITVLNYLKSKFWLFIAICTISYILTLPYGFFGHQIALINFSLFIYNAGVSSFVLIFFGTYNRARIDLGKSQFMNYEGTSAAQWVSMIPVLGLPFLVMLICKLAGFVQITFYVLLVAGALGLIFHEHILTLLTKSFMKNKYKMAAAFRK